MSSKCPVKRADFMKGGPFDCTVENPDKSRCEEQPGGIPAHAGCCVWDNGSCHAPPADDHTSKPASIPTWVWIVGGVVLTLLIGGLVIRVIFGGHAGNAPPSQRMRAGSANNLEIRQLTPTTEELVTSLTSI